jgi:putative Mg2+ transporter-C (MgtC) family protein
MDFEKIFQFIRPELYILFQALIALTLGGFVGWEREAAGKWAGLRTHMLVCLAAMLLVRVGQFLIIQTQHFILLYAENPGQIILRIDPIRMIEAIVTGIAFLGAGTIFRDPDASKMRGLTTAASLLIVVPIGISIAVNRYILAVGITLLALVVLRVLMRLEPRARREPKEPHGDHRL